MKATKFKVGDVIRRKDMPSLLFVVTSEDPGWGGRYFVKSLQKGVLETDDYGYKHRSKKGGFVFKDDDRWESAKRRKKP